MIVVDVHPFLAYQIINGRKYLIYPTIRHDCGCYLTFEEEVGSMYCNLCQKEVPLNYTEYWNDLRTLLTTWVDLEREIQACNYLMNGGSGMLDEGEMDTIETVKVRFASECWIDTAAGEDGDFVEMLISPELEQLHKWCRAHHIGTGPGGN